MLPPKPRQKAVPRLRSQFRVLRELALEHQLFDTVDGVDVLHAVEHDPTDFFDGFEGAHDADGVALYEDVALREEFDCLWGKKKGGISINDRVKRNEKKILKF